MLAPPWHRSSISLSEGTKKMNIKPDFQSGPSHLPVTKTLSWRHVWAQVHFTKKSIRCFWVRSWIEFCVLHPRFCIKPDKTAQKRHPAVYFWSITITIVYWLLRHDHFSNFSSENRSPKFDRLSLYPAKDFFGVPDARAWLSPKTCFGQMLFAENHCHLFKGCFLKVLYRTVAKSVLLNAAFLRRVLDIIHTANLHIR